MDLKSTSRLLATLILAIVFIGALNSQIVMPYPSSSSSFGQHPQTYFSPPASQPGIGYQMDLTGSVNGWQSHDLKANNTFTQYNNRSDSFYNSPPPLAWQDITIKNIVATYDIREIQGGDPTSYYGCGQLSAGPPPRYPMLAMSFTPADTVNITVVRLFYSAFNNPPLIMLHIVPDSGGPQPTPAPIALSLGYGSLSNTANPAWHDVSVSTPSGHPITLTGGTRYWIVMDGSSIPGTGNYYEWYYSPDITPPPYDENLACYYTNNWKQESDLGPGWNFLTLVRVLPVGGSMQPRVYGSPAQVNMYLYLNSTIQPINSNTTWVGNNVRLFTFVTNTSVTFSVTWRARMEVSVTGAVSTRYIARDGFTLWNASFSSTASPSNPYTWYNLTYKITSVPQLWSQTSPPTNITNTLGYSSTFAYGAGYYLINQTIVGNSWLANSWLIRTRSSYKIGASMPSQIVAGLPLTVSISSSPLVNTWCNISFYDSADHIEYTNNASITGSLYSLTLKLNRSDSYTLFLFDKWTLGNEANLNRTLTVTVIKPLCNLTVDSMDTPILGNLATAKFRFLNGTAGWASMSPLSVQINGTYISFSYGGGVATVSWSTALGGWRSGLNQVNITAISGVFFNSTVYPITILPPNAVLLLNATSYLATYGDNVPIGLTFLNVTGGGTPFPSTPTLYRNGSSVGPLLDLGGGSYAYVLSTRAFAQAGAYHLNFTAKYGTYVATNITLVTVSRLGMVISLQLDQTSVTAGSSLSASATLRYPNGTNVEDMTDVTFRFTVTFGNGTSPKQFNVSKVTVGGSCSASFVTDGNMKKISVEAIYDGDGIRTSANDAMPDIPVTAATTGFPVIVVVGVAGVAVLLALVPMAVRARRRRGREEEHKKTAMLRQTASLAQLVVVDLRSGRCAFSRSLGSEESVDPNLISGFLSANQALLGEVFKNKARVRAGLRFADYGDYKVISHVGNYIMATLFATEAAGQELKDVLEKFTDRFEKKYAGTLESWDGNIDRFKDADEIADEVFALPLTSPYMVLDVPSAKLSDIEKAAVENAKYHSAERGVFFMPRIIDYLLTKRGLKRGKAMDVINSLTHKGIFKQLTIEQAAQIVKSKSGSTGG